MASFWGTFDYVTDAVGGAASYAYESAASAASYAYHTVANSDAIYRVGGALQAVGGAAEMTLGGSLMVAPEPTLTKVGGAALVFHGADNMATGFNTMYYGRPNSTVTATALSSGLQAGGMRRDWADWAAQTADGAIGVLVPAKAGQVLSRGLADDAARAVDKVRTNRGEQSLQRTSQEGLNPGAASSTVPVSGPANVRVRSGTSGELQSAFAKIEPGNIGQGTATNASSTKFVRRLGNATDDAGHGIGQNLGGLGGVRAGNIFPQAPSVNRGAFNQFEQQIARRVEAGDSVFVRVVPRYRTGETRPFEILYQARINGQTVNRTFPNP